MKTQNQATLERNKVGDTMKRFFGWIGLAALSLSLSLHAAAQEKHDAWTEPEALAALAAPAASLQDKDNAILRLKRIGTAAAVPAIAASLSDPQMAPAAINALEGMPGKAAGKALIDGLATVASEHKATLIMSLAVRREAQAEPALIALLADANPLVARAAATALGNLGGETGTAALQQALGKPELKSSVQDALLEVAARHAAAGKSAEALKLYESLYASEDSAVKLAAYSGMIETADESKALSLVLQGIQSADGPTQSAALDLARSVKDPKANQALAKLLPKLTSPAVQAAVISALHQRGDLAAEPAVIAEVANADAYVRLTAIEALGDLGGVNSVVPLANAAAKGDEAEKKAARQSLLDLRQGKVADEYLNQLEKGTPEVQIEIVRALEGRGATDAVPRLLELAKGGSDTARKAAFTGLSRLAGPDHAAAMVALVAGAKDDAGRQQAVDALVNAIRRIKDAGGTYDAAAIAQALGGSATPEAKTALLQTAKVLNDGSIRLALRTALAGPDSPAKTAAIRAMAQTGDSALLPDLLNLARTTPDANTRTMALRGYIRLATDPGAALIARERVEALNAALPLAQTPEDKWQVLSGLTPIPSAEGLKLAASLLTDDSTKNEAVQAIAAFSTLIAPEFPAAAREGFAMVLAASADEALRKTAEAGIALIDAQAGYITAWQAAGPYVVEDGMDVPTLFAQQYAPETGKEPVKWERLVAGSKADMPFWVQIDNLYPGKERMAYLRTRVYSNAQSTLTLELGSQERTQVKFNGETVGKLDAPAGFNDGPEKYTVHLDYGWSVIEIKITHEVDPWQFYVRLLKADGTPADGSAAVYFPPVGLIYDAQFEKEVTATDPTSSVAFQKTILDPAFRSEGIAVADFNADGKLDINTGNAFFAGPDWKQSTVLSELATHQPIGYSNQFLCFPALINGDKLLDLIVVGFPGAATRWLANPGSVGGPWNEAVAIQKTGCECPEWIDADGDGKPELVYGADTGLVSFAQPGADPTQLWNVTAIASPGEPGLGHGLGFGDLNGDKLDDVLCPDGWWERPADPAAKPWKFHAAKLAEACAQMYVYDVDADGDADVVSSSAHHIGFWWAEQKPEGWELHTIDTAISQMHALAMADIDGDGINDFITGKRLWAHVLGDTAPEALSMLVWYKLTRENGKPVFTRHTIDYHSGVGLHFFVGDLNGDSKPDIVTSNKNGVNLFTQTAAQ